MSSTGDEVSRLLGSCRDYRAATGIFSHIPATRKASIHAGFDWIQALATGITGMFVLLLREKRKEEEEVERRRKRKTCPNSLKSLQKHRQRLKSEDSCGF